MRIRSLLLCLSPCWSALGVVAQESTPAAPPEPVLAVTAGTVHPVAGPAIRNGVVLIRGQRIAAVGPAGEVTIPEGAQVLQFPEGHVYPGLIDALTDAYLDDAQRNDGSADPGIELAPALQLRHSREDELVRHGVTTVYVGSRANSQWRGIGAVVRPQGEGFTVMTGRERAGLQFRLASGPTGTALQRIQAAEAIKNLTNGLEAYEKSFKDHEEALAKYQKDYDAYLAHFQKAAPGTEPPAGEGASRGSGETRSGGEGRPTGPGRGGRQGRGGRGETPPNPNPNPGPGPNPSPTPEPAPAPTGNTPQNPANAPARPAEGPPAPGETRPAAPKAPEKPKYPKAPARDPAKDALIAVRDGKLPLRVEAWFHDEITAALQQASAGNVPPPVFEQAFGAAPAAAALAAAGASCVLTEHVHGQLGEAFDDFAVERLPRALHDAGVTFALATGSSRRAAHLPLLAAAAVGNGLPADAALRAITLSPAEILGIAKDTGSLTAGKLADLVICDRNLFASDCRVLRVLSAGSTQYEAKAGNQ